MTIRLDIPGPIEAAFEWLPGNVDRPLLRNGTRAPVWRPDPLPCVLGRHRHL